MQSRREVREATIQFLYCNDLEDGAPASQATEAFWELLLEDDFTKLTKASVKSVLHLNQGRQKRYNKLVEKAPEAQATISADPSAKKLSLALNAILKSENIWQSLIDRIQRIYKPENQEVPVDLTEALKELYLLNDTITTQRARWDEQVSDHPHYKKQTESIRASISALSKISERIHMIQNPTEFPAHGDVKHLVDTAKKMTTFKDLVNDLVQLVISNKAKIDTQIHAIVENYKPERIDPVDRAILRLGTAEILYKDETPTPVAINEAIEIAQIFSSSDSSKFINGVLDKIAKTNV